MNNTYIMSLNSEAVEVRDCRLTTKLAVLDEGFDSI